MNKKTLNRFGDTCFRIANQINFYTNILKTIYEWTKKTNDENNAVTAYEFYHKYINHEITNYNTNGKINRSNMWDKELRNLGLTYRDNNDRISISQLGIKFIEMINDVELQKIDIIQILWFYLMINTHTKLKDLFRSFTKYIYTNNSNHVVNKSLIYDFVTCQSSVFKPNEKTSYALSENKLNEILYYENIQQVVKLRKPSKVNLSLPKLINSINDDNKLVLLLNDKDLYDEIINAYKLHHYVKKGQRINSTNEILEFIKLRNKQLINDVLNCINNRTIEKDYYDINKRWFIQCGFLNYDGNELIVNLENKALYIQLLDVEFDEELIEFKKFISKIRIDTNITIQYPYNKDEIIKMLQLMNENHWDSLRKTYELDGIERATIFEYIVNLSFAVSYNVQPNDFKQYCYTILDSNLKPRCHASGGRPDGLIHDGNFLSTIESTIHQRLEDLINKERTAIQRHALKKYEDCVKTIYEFKGTNPVVTFVILNEINAKVIDAFMSYEACKYFDDKKIIIKTILLSCEQLIKMFKLNCLNKIENIIQHLPINESEDIEQEYHKIMNQLTIN